MGCSLGSDWNRQLIPWHLLLPPAELVEAEGGIRPRVSAQYCHWHHLCQYQGHRRFLLVGAGKESVGALPNSCAGELNALPVLVQPGPCPQPCQGAFCLSPTAWLQTGCQSDFKFN